MNSIIEQLKFLLASPMYNGKLQVLKPATLLEVELAEEELGFELPSLLRQIYLEVANGGFHGMLGLNSGWTDDFGYTSMKLYRENRIHANRYKDWQWREGLLPIYYGGCTVHFLLDCNLKNNPILKWDSGRLFTEPIANSFQELLLEKCLSYKV